MCTLLNWTRVHVQVNPARPPPHLNPLPGAPKAFIHLKLGTKEGARMADYLK